MILLAILLILFGTFKFIIMNKLNADDLDFILKDSELTLENAYNTVKGILLVDGLLSVLCGLYIILI